MFPELREKFQAGLARIFPENQILSLGLKEAVFSSITAAEYAKSWPKLNYLLGGGMPAWSGESVNAQTALEDSVIWTCVRIISESIGFLPANVIQTSDEGSKREAKELPIYAAIKMAPNDEITSQEFREMLTAHTLLHGNGYGLIHRRSGTGVALGIDPLPSEMVQPDREKTGQKRLVYIVREAGVPDKTYTVQEGKPHDILHVRGLGWDGIQGMDVVTMARHSWGTSRAARRNAAIFWKRGGRLPSVLEMEKRFKDEEDAKKFRTEFEAISDDPWKIPILENDIHLKPTGLSMVDAQSVEFNQAMIPEICRWFRISPHLAGDLSRATFSNIEQLQLEFATLTLAPWASRFENAFWRCVFTPEEKAKGYSLRLNMNAILRGDFKGRMEGYASALQNGHMSVDEVRELEDRNKLAGGIGAHYHIQTNMGTLVRDGQIQPAAPALVRLDEEEPGGTGDEEDAAA